MHPTAIDRPAVLLGAGCASLLVLLVGAGGAASPPPAGDLARGEQVYARCMGCHSLEVNRTGPRHCGLARRAAGSVPGFAYSTAMQQSGITWDAASLDRFLADPTGVVPGTTMTFAGVPDPAERRDLVAWLLDISHSERCEATPAAAATP